MIISVKVKLEKAVHETLSLQVGSFLISGGLCRFDDNIELHQINCKMQGGAISIIHYILQLC